MSATIYIYTFDFDFSFFIVTVDKSQTERHFCTFLPVNNVIHIICEVLCDSKKKILDMEIV